MSIMYDRRVVSAGVVGAVGCVGLFMYLKSQMKREYHRVATVSKLYLYPVKSLQAIEVDEGLVTDKGFKSNGIFDRSFMLIDENNRFVTGRRVPKMILICPAFSEDKKHLILRADGQPDISVPLNQNGGETINTKIWSLGVTGIDCGDEVAQWLSNYLGGTYRLVYHSEEMPGKMMQEDSTFGHQMKSNEVSLFQDLAHFTMLGDASVADLNSRLDEPITERNFRPNICVRDCPAFAEDFWKYVKIGDNAELRFTHYCRRCKLTTLNQKAGAFTSLEPLKTLKEYRQCYSFVKDRKSYATSPIFSVNLNMEAEGTIRVGDPVYATLQYQEYAGKQ